MMYTGFKNVSKTSNCVFIGKRDFCIILPMVIARRAFTIVEKRIITRFQNPVGVSHCKPISGIFV
jgi:hypothetical protein